MSPSGGDPLEPVVLRRSPVSARKFSIIVAYSTTVSAKKARNHGASQSGVYSVLIFVAPIACSSVPLALFLLGPWLSRTASLDDQVYAKCMANLEHLAKLREGVNAWNLWRRENPGMGADLRRGGAKELDQYKIDLRHARLEKTDLAGFDLSFADLHRATLWRSDLAGANLEGADLSSVNLNFANLSGANLRRAILRYSRLAEADVSESLFSGSFVYASSIWNVKGQPKEQVGIVITPKLEPEITVDDIEVAQFIFLLLSRRKLRNVITTLGEKAVLILGRFTERKDLLDSMAEKLRSLGYLPIIFDFERPSDRDLTETVKVLAGLSRFVIADITNPRSVPLELQATVPDYMVPFVTILERGQPVFGMFDDLPKKYNWALPLLEYKSADTLLAAFEQKVVNPALEKAQEVRIQKAAAPQRRSAED